MRASEAYLCVIDVLRDNELFIEPCREREDGLEERDTLRDSGVRDRGGAGERSGMAS